MQGKKQVTYEDVNNFVISIRCCNIEEIKRVLDEYDPIIVNRLQTQNRQPSLYFSAAVIIDQQQSYQIMKLLIDHGANPNFKDGFQQTVLFYVCRDGKEKCFDLLIQKGANPEQVDVYGQTPIYYAANENRINIVKKLIDLGANLNRKDLIGGQTPLFYAARSGHIQICKLLVQNGCDVSITDQSNKLASTFAKKNSHNEVFEYLNAQLNTIKQTKKIQIPVQNPVESGQKKEKKKREYDKLPSNLQTKNTTSTYRLYRADNYGNLQEVTYEQFQELAASNPELSQMMHKPEEIDTSQIEQIKIKDSWIKKVNKIITICWKAKGGFHFHQPVDPVKYGIDDYFDIIVQPMDFGTIKKKLAGNLYKDIQDFTRDMLLVFDNCVKYNGEQNSVAKYALQIKSIFQENMRQEGLMK